MPCTDQSGVRNIALLENVGFSKVYDNSYTYIESISTLGDTISITNDQRPDYSDNESIGDNFKLMHLHNIKHYIFDYEGGITRMEALNNIYGWYTLITFNSGMQYLVNSPIFYIESPEFNSANTHTWEINLQSEVGTFDGLIEYSVVK